jgi:hypothetical protein
MPVQRWPVGTGRRRLLPTQSLRSTTSAVMPR